MILYNEKVRELLKIFENPKSLSPYDNLREKEEMQNASTFINNYHMYGPPKKQNFDGINRNTSLNNKNDSIVNSALGNQNIDPYDLEIKRSINNLRIGREQYLKQEEQTKSLNRAIYGNINQYGTYNPYSTSTYSCQLQKNRTIFNNILNSKTLTSTQYPQYGTYTYNTNSRKSYNPKYSTYSKLKEIPSNPEDVEIKELPPNYTISVNPILNSSVPVGMPAGMNMNMNMSQNVPPMISQNLNEPPKLIEEINTDIIDNEDIQKNEEPEMELNQNPQNEEVTAETVEEPQSSGK